jgi:hypothetical protein
MHNDPTGLDSETPFTTDALAVQLANDLRLNRAFLAECERVALNRDVGIDTRFMAMDRATRLIRANIAAAALLLRQEKDAKNPAREKSSNEYGKRPPAKKTWEDVRREVELHIRTREAEERENEKFRQTNGSPRIWQP